MKWLKKAFYFIFKADSKMIGGNKIIRKKSANDFYISFKAPLYLSWSNNKPAIRPKRVVRRVGWMRWLRGCWLLFFHFSSRDSSSSFRNTSSSMNRMDSDRILVLSSSLSWSPVLICYCIFLILLGVWILVLIIII